MAEPDWTKPIASGTLCNWFYFFFYLNTVVAAILFIMILYVAFTRNIFKAGGLGAVPLFTMILQLGIAATSALFHYLICDRALKPSA